MTTASKVTDFVFNATAAPPYVRFNVTGLDGTAGSCDVIFPSDLLWGTFSLYLDGVPLTEGVDYAKSENGTHWTFHINYTHSTHTILIGGTGAIPEFTAATATLLLIITATFAVIFSAKIRKSARLLLNSED
jgi:hypothetical protein